MLFLSKTLGKRFLCYDSFLGCFAKQSQKKICILEIGKILLPLDPPPPIPSHPSSSPSSVLIPSLPPSFSAVAQIPGWPLEKMEKRGTNAVVWAVEEGEGRRAMKREAICSKNV